MPRIRTVKPEFWSDEKLASMPRDARLLFIGLLNFADDEGRMRGSPMLVRAQVFPYDLDVDAESLLRTLAERSVIVRYEVESESFIWIRNFTKHQKIDRPSKSAFPAPPPDRPHSRSTKTRRRPGDESPLEGKGKEGNGEDKASPGVAARPPVAAVPEKLEGVTVPTWTAYEAAYQRRYSVAPVRNKTVNGVLAQFVSRVGAEEAPKIAEFYVGHNWKLYVNAVHPVQLLLRDAEKLRTEWATGRTGEPHGRNGPGASIHISEQSKQEAVTPGRKFIE